jgi:beta-glucanase (GH16 family)
MPHKRATRTLAAVTFALFIFLAATTARTQSPDGAQQPAKWTLTFSDEFNSPDGSRPDPAKWKFDIGAEKWGNNELEYYTNRPENSVIRGGNLVITALKEKTPGENGKVYDYTSARLKTQGLFSQAYGKFEARIKIPGGQGMWPAFWLLGDDITTVGWPKCGEIDIMENIGKSPSSNFSSMHGPGYSGNQGYTSEFRFPGGVKLSDDFHVFTMEWEPDVARFYLDGEWYATFTPKRLPPGLTWVFDHPMFIILNVAVGGDWPGSPDAQTKFPNEMLVDYVRVYKRN